MNKPNYLNSITNLSNSILKHFGVEPFHPTIKVVDEALEGKKKVIVFLFDALGKAVLEKHLDKNSFLRSHVITNMTSTLPPTTVAATTSMLSGKYPIETGWLGWSLYFKDLNRNIDVFPNVDSDTDEKLSGKNVMREYAPYKNIAQLINEANKKEIAHIYMGYPVDKENKKLRKLKSFIKNAFDVASSQDESFVYAYWTNPDSLMHKYGVTHRKVHRCILNIEKLIKKYSSLHQDVSVIVIADHGMKDVKSLNLNMHPDLVNMLVRPFSFEKRCINFFVKDEYKVRFKDLFKKYYDGLYEIYTREEALNEKLFGDAYPCEQANAFLGDFIAVALTGWMIESRDLKSKEKPFFKAHHAGSTLDELEVSIIFLNK